MTSREAAASVAVAHDEAAGIDVVTLGGEALAQYRRFTAYNSPYVAHDRGRAVDLYPMDGTAPSPVAGEVLATETVRAPPKPYAPAEDHLVVVDCGPVVARIMHVEPSVSVGEHVDVGQDLGELVRAGFFAPWVPTHLHVGFRHHDQDHVRASGSLPLTLAVDPTPVDWDGTGTVVATDETSAVLDAPDSLPAGPSPDPGSGGFAGLAATVDGDRVVLDGGFQHYDAGGIHADATGPVELLGEHVGDAHHTPGSTNAVAWRPTTVLANGTPVHGLSLWCGRDGDYAIKLVGEDHGLDVGDTITVELASPD